MLEMIRNTLLAGLGAGVITRDKARQAVQSLVEQGRLSKEEAEQLVDRLLDSGSQQWEELQSGLRKAINQAIESSNVARASEVAELRRRIDNMEQRLRMLEDGVAGGGENLGP